MSRPDSRSRPQSAATRGKSFALLIVWLLAASALPAAVLSPPPRTFRVSYLSANAVYIDGGRAEQLATGAQLEIRRNGEVVALVEVTYVADHSSSCRLLSQKQAPRQGDQVILLASAAATAPAAPAAGTAPAASAAPTQVQASRPAAAQQIYTPPTPKPPTTRLSGNIAAGFQKYSDRGPAKQNYDQGTGRLGLRLRDIQGLPLDVRVRMSGWQVNSSGFGPGASTSSHSNRLYELSATYAPVDGRFSWSAGRLGASPFVSIGYLDGLLGQFRLTPRFYVGAFAGSRPEVLELNISSAGRKYGSYLRYNSRPDDGPTYAEIVLAGIGEYAQGGLPSREYAALDSRFGNGSRWSLFEHLEIDFNRGWRKTVAKTSSQISNASLSASVKLSDTVRAQLSYSQRRNYLTYETRPLPEEVFTRILNQGARASVQWQGRSGWNVSGGVGQERSDRGGDKPTNSGSLSVYKTNLFGWALMAGADVSYYDGGVANGYVGSVRLRKYLAHGNDLGLTLGASSAQISTLGLHTAARQNQWVRLSGTWQLPLQLYLMGELEYDTGDDLEGQRYTLEIGYHF